MNQSIVREQQRLDYLFSLVANVDNDELKAHWSRYLCVLVSGFVENAFKIIINEYVFTRAHRNIFNYINQRIKNITNLKAGRITETLYIFSKDWGGQFEGEISDEQKEALGAVYTNRNAISHGSSPSISYVRMRDYYVHIRRIIELIDDVINR